MYAIVANGIATVCETYKQLQLLTALYPYPKFRKCSTREEAREWIQNHGRGIKSVKFDNYGDTGSYGYVTVWYSIKENSIKYTVDTSRLGYIHLKQDKSLIADTRREKIKAEYLNVSLDNELITSHIGAIKIILGLLGPYVDVNIVVPDMSIYLAITKYTGTNYLIRGIQGLIRERLGAVAITVSEGEA